MDVALDLFVKQGSVATPVTAIEAAAGLSSGSGSFYRHFKDKAELLLAVVERELALVQRDRLAQLENSAASTQLTLARRLRSDLDWLDRMKPLISILFWERDGIPGMAERVERLITDRGVDAGVADLLARTGIRPVRADVTAATTVLMSALIGYFLSVEYFGAPPSGVDPDRFTGTLADLLTVPDQPQ